MPYIYALSNKGMPQLIKFVYDDDAIGVFVSKINLRQISQFESPYKYNVVCSIEVVDLSGWSRLYIALNKCGFESLHNNFYDINGNIQTIIHLFKQLVQYEQLLYEEIIKKNTSIPYKKLSNYIDNIYKHEESFEHQPRKHVDIPAGVSSSMIRDLSRIM